MLLKLIQIQYINLHITQSRSVRQRSSKYIQSLYTICYKNMHHVSKNKQNYFCYNYVKLPPKLTIFGTMMANCLKLYEVHSFSTSTFWLRLGSQPDVRWQLRPTRCHAGLHVGVLTVRLYNKQYAEVQQHSISGQNTVLQK